MKLIIGIDGSTACTGWSFFDENGKLIKYGQIKPKTTLSTLGKIHYISIEFLNLLNLTLTNGDEIKIAIIEDIFKRSTKGFATLGRISGALMTVVWIATGKDVDVIKLRPAVTARPMVGLQGDCQKAETQCWMMDKFTQINTDDYYGMIDAIYAKRNTSEINQKQFKKRMLAVSKIIENDTDISEDIADSVLLSYGEVIKND